ncbi:MAG: hypothetical protein P4L64_05395 [Caulobacteraceae bacterium]|nr:hypothetical protein [Caulobacteraceae bacterium]
MKFLAALCAIAFLAFGVTTQASASPTLGPVSTFFVGTGATSLTKSGITIGCTANLQGDIDSSGVGHITDAYFTSGSSLCFTTTAIDLPWTATANFVGISGGIVNIYPFAVSTVLGSCGGSLLTVNINTSGVISFSDKPLLGGCTVSGSIQTTPRVYLVP